MPHSSFRFFFLCFVNMPPTSIPTKQVICQNLSSINWCLVWSRFHFFFLSRNPVLFFSETCVCMLLFSTLLHRYLRVKRWLTSVPRSCNVSVQRGRIKRFFATLIRELLWSICPHLRLFPPRRCGVLIWIICLNPIRVRYVFSPSNVNIERIRFFVEDRELVALAESDRRLPTRVKFIFLFCIWFLFFISGRVMIFFFLAGVLIARFSWVSVTWEMSPTNRAWAFSLVGLEEPICFYFCLVYRDDCIFEARHFDVNCYFQKLRVCVDFFSIVCLKVSFPFVDWWTMYRLMMSLNTLCRFMKNSRGVDSDELAVM